MNMDKTEASGVFKTQVDSSINYMEEIDETLNHAQKKLIVTLSCQKKREEIEKIAKALKGDIKNLAQTIQDILDKHHKDYISTFASFMDTVRKDLKLKLEQMEKIEEEKRKINDVKIIKCERDYFRLESVRMNKLCKTLSSKIDDMALRMKILSDEVNNLTIKWKDSETTNKQLFLELESSMQAQKEIEKEMLGLKEIIQNGSSKPTDIISSENRKTDIDEDKEKYLYLIDKLKMELKKEKLRNHKSLSELNKILLEKNRLQNIFIDCVEETRKNIFNRRLKENLNYKNGKMKTAPNLNIEINTQYDSFLPSDKKAILENFVFNDEVSNIIREAIFNKPQKDKEYKTAAKNIMSKVNLPELEDFNKPNLNIVDHTKTSFFRTGKLTMTNFSRKHSGNNNGFSFKL